MQELNGNRHKLNHMGRNHPGKRPSPICPSKPIYSLSSRCTHVKRPTKVHLPALQPTNARFTPGRGTAFLTNSGDCYKRHDAQIDTMVFATNAVAFTPQEDIPPHSDGLDGESSVKNPAMPSIPAVESSNQREQSSQSRRVPWGIEDVGPILNALDGKILARMFLSTTKAVRQEQRMSFARSLRHTLRLFYQGHNALQVAPANSPHNEAPPR